MTSDSPTARALRVLELIQSRPGVTADQLAARLDVSARAARRHVAILREAGIAVDSVPGPGGGYRPGRGLRAAPIVFASEELLALVMAVLEAADDRSRTSTVMGEAMAKLLGALPRRVALPAETVCRGTAATPPSADRRPDPEHTATLVTAATEHRRVDIRYRLPDGRELERTIEPRAVVVRHTRWYLLCRSVTSDEARAYRLDRVVESTVLDEVFAPPAPFDPAEELGRHLSTGWEFPVRVVIRAPADDVTGWLPRTMGEVTSIDDASCRLDGSTSNAPAYAADLAHLPVDFEVTAGSEVRAALGALGRRLGRAVAG